MPEFITHGFLGHLTYVLLIVSMLMRRMMWLRLFVILSCFAGIAFDFFILNNPVGVFWQILLVSVNIVQIALLWSRDRRAKFSAEEQGMIDVWMLSGTPGNRRLLLDMGRWETLEPGVVLTEEGKRPRFLTYLATGSAQIMSGAHEVGQITPGHFIGEMSLIGDKLASADVTIHAPSRVWQIERNKLDRMRTNQPELFAMIEAGISLNLRAKVISGNTALKARGQTAP